MPSRTLALTLAALALAPLSARAQSAAAVSVGVCVTSYDPSGQASLGSASIGPMLRLRTGPGTGPAIGFDWYSIGVHTEAGDRTVPVGEMRVRPFMGGLAYTVMREPYAIGLSLTGGVAVTGIHVDGRAREAYAQSIGAASATIGVSNSFVWRSQLSLWYDLTGRIGLNASIAYISAHPHLILSSERGVERRPISASPVVLTFGFAYGLF